MRCLGAGYVRSIGYRSRHCPIPPGLSAYPHRRMAAGEQPRYAFLHRERGVVPVTTGPQDPAAAGRDRLRAGHADREQVIEALKDAFVHGG